MKDKISVDKIKKNIAGSKQKSYDVRVLDVTESTNEDVKSLAKQGAGHGLVVISDCQTAGKGRRGRSFFSPAGCGLYISMLFEPNGNEAKDMVLVTTQAAIAVSLAIEEVYGIQTSIKWVNDVWIGDKKVCGILSEAVSESGNVDYVVVGIGINVIKPESVPDEIKDIAGYILDAPDKNIKDGRSRLAAAVIEHMYEMYESLPDRSYMDEYKKRSIVIGKRVVYGASTDAGENKKEGLATDITDDGGLVVELDDGDIEVLHTGEITLRTV